MRRIQLASTLLGLALTAPAMAQGPTLVPATLRNVSPAGVVRGRTVELVLDGLNISRAAEAVFDDPAIQGVVRPGAGVNQARVTAVVGDQAALGVHRVYLLTPLGTTGAVTFAVGAWPEVPEAPGAPGASPPLVPVPSTVVGSLSAVGESDTFRFAAPPGRVLTFQVIAAPLRSRLQSVLTLVDGQGRVLAEAQGADSRPDAVLSYAFREGGEYRIRLRDFENSGGGDVTYRLNLVDAPVVDTVFPLGLRKGDTGAEIGVSGPGLPLQRVRVSAAATGSTVIRETPAGPLLTPVRLAVGDEPEVMEGAGPNDAPAAAEPVEVPVTINGRIAGPQADADCYRFTAKRGQELLLEVNARRLGSPLDSVVEVLDAAGKPVERATLRPVAETVTALNDRDSASPALRMLTWNDFAVNDYVYVRGELIQLVAMPRGPDDDARFRSVRGQRAGLLDTTPGAVALNTAMYRVQVHPPGRTFPPNGMPLFRLYYRNDDGGPLYGKDSRLLFTAPADGAYVARITDVRGVGGPRHAYRLTLRAAQPGFQLSLVPEHPNVPAGASVPVEVNVDRLEGFDGPIHAHLENLPPGITATPVTIEAGELGGTLLLTAAPDAHTAADPGRPPVRLVGLGVAAGGEIVRTTEPGGGRCTIAVLPRADLTVRTTTPRVTMRPGEEQWLEVAITRENGFTGRVPIEARNLPFGVRVLDVGLNGVLITEEEAVRRFQIVCEPWVKPTQRPIYCTVRTETGSAASTEVGVRLLLEVRGP